MRSGMKGFTLMELVICVAILSIISGAAVVMYGSKVRMDMENKTLEILEELYNGVLRYYDIVGSLPSSCSVLGLPYTSLSNPSKDAWGREITLFSTSNGLILVSSGVNGILESSVGQNESFLPGGDDFYRIVSSMALMETKRGKTMDSLRRANAGLSVYLASGLNDLPECSSSYLNTGRCASALSANDYIVPYDAYDQWGRYMVLVLRNGQLELISTGPDGVSGNSDDVITGRLSI